MYREALLTAFIALVMDVGVAYGADKDDFVKKASQSGDFEITSSELAQDKAQSGIKPEDKGVGQKTEHTDDMEKLQEAKPDEFDSVYISIQRQAHEEAVQLFADYSKNGDDPKLKQFATDTLPTLRTHLEHANKLKGKQ